MENDTQLPEIVVTPEPDKLIQLAPEGGDAPPPMELAPESTSGMVQPPSAELAKKRSFKASMGLKDVMDMSADDIYKNILEGKEDEVRRQAAAALDHQNFMRKQKLLVDLANKKQGPLTSDEVNAVMSPLNPSNQSVDPESVIEEAYARKYTNSVKESSANMGGTKLDDASKEIPQQVEDAENKATELVKRIEFARKITNNLDEEIHNQGWLPWLADQAKSAVQIYPEYKLRGNVKEVGRIAGGLTLGTNLQNQADALFGKPFDQFKKELTDITNYLRKDNPTLAKTFAEYVLGKSAQDRMLDSAMTVFLPSEISAMGKMGANLATKGALFNYTRKAFKDAVKKAAEEEVTPASIAEAAGDLEQAAILKTVDNKVNGKSLTPTDTLMTNMRLDRELLSTNPGSLTKDQITILENQSKATESAFADTVTNVNRVRRAIDPLDNPDSVKKLNEWVKKLFKGSETSVLDVKDPVRETVTGTYSHDVHLGTQEGHLFRDPEVAKANAEARGFKDVRIEPATGSVQAEDATLAGLKSDIKRKGQLEESISILPDAIRKARAKIKDKALAEEVKKEAREDLKFFQAKLKEYKETLAKINERVAVVPPKIVQDGLGYKLVVNVPVRENTDLFRDLLIQSREGRSTNSSEGIMRSIHAALGWVSGADVTLSKYESMQRKTAVYGKNAFQKWLYEEGEIIRQVASGEIKFDPVTGERISSLISKPKAYMGLGKELSRKEVAQQFNEVLKFAKTGAVDEQGRPGAFFKTPGALEDHYQRFYNRIPTFQEQQAYFSYVRQIEAERAYYEIAEFRNRSIRGAQQHSVSLTGNDKAKITSDTFDGVQEVKFPGGSDQILILGDKPGQEKLLRIDHIRGNARKMYEQQVAQGQAKVIRVWDPSTNPFGKIAPVADGRYVRYVMSRNVETKPLEFNHINRREGGHFEYNYKNYIKQADIQEEGGINNYFGDKTLAPIEGGALGKKIIKTMHETMALMREGKIAEAKVAAKKLPWDWDDWEKMFKPSVDPNGNRLPPRFSLDQEFHVVPKNQRIYDISTSLQKKYGNSFVDLAKSGSDAAQFNTVWNKERDAQAMFTIIDKGSRDVPHFELAPADMVDPIPSMNRALERAVNSVFMDDYKFMAVEHWLKEAEPYIRDPQAARSNPFWYFRNPDWKPGTPKDIISNFMSNQKKINNFIGIPDKFDTWIQGVTQSLVDAAYLRYGPKDSRNFLDKVKTYPITMLDKVTDPFDYMRSMAFHYHLGLFSVHQFLVQAQSHATIWALSPEAGTTGTFGSLLHTWAKYTRNPEVLNKLDEMYTKLGLGSRAKPGEFLEAMKEAEKTGFFHVGGEYVVRNDVGKPNFVGNDFKSFLDLGTSFFRAGEKSTRQTAWFTAFREFRKENPTGAISLADRQRILDRADLLTTNMSRASASILHTGPLSLTSQFLSYQIRLGELFLSKRISAGDRARLIGTYAALYGVPASLGVTGIPAGDAIRSEVIDRGYVPGESSWKSLLMEGFLAWSIAMITGKGDVAKGDWYNVGSRYGVQGFTQIRDAMRSDSSVFKFLGGASLSSLADTVASSDNFMRAMMSYFRTDDQSVFPLTIQDFIEPLRPISSVNRAWMVFAAINTGKWMTRNQAHIADVSAWQAAFMGLTGLNPLAQDDMFVKSGIKKSEIEYQKHLEKEFTTEHIKGLQQLSKGDYEEANKYFTRARRILELGGYPLDKRADMLAKANSRSGLMTEDLDMSFALKNVPTNKWFQGNVPQTRLEQLRTQLRMQQNKENQ